MTQTLLDDTLNTKIGQSPKHVEVYFFLIYLSHHIILIGESENVFGRQYPHYEAQFQHLSGREYSQDFKEDHDLQS